MPNTYHDDVAHEIQVVFGLLVELECLCVLQIISILSVILFVNSSQKIQKPHYL